MTLHLNTESEFDMNPQELQEKIKSILDKESTLCLSTSSRKGVPESAIVYYSTDNDSNFYFLTKELTRKKQHLDENNEVSLLLSDHESCSTLQIQGKAKELVTNKEKISAFNSLIKIIGEGTECWPPPIGRVEMGNLCLYKVTPYWMRLGNFKASGKDIFEQLIDQA